MEWLKWIIDASKIGNKTSPSIGLLCMDNKGRIVASLDKKIGDVPVLDAAAISIREALRAARDRNMDKIFIESNSQIVINSVRGLIKVPSQIINHVIDIVI